MLSAACRALARAFARLRLSDDRPTLEVMVRVADAPTEGVIEFGGRPHAREILSSVHGEDKALLQAWARCRLLAFQVRDTWFAVLDAKVPLDPLLAELTARQVFADSNGVRKARKHYLASYDSVTSVGGQAPSGERGGATREGA
jgi:hypothetical protein